MAEFKLDRFKFRWRGDWTASTSYRRDDIVRLNGKSWVCLVTHTSNADFEQDLTATVPDSNPPLPNPYWTVMTDGKSFVGSWSQGTVYYLGDIALKDGSLYICTNIHTASTFGSDFSNWEIYANHIDFVGNWANSTDYGPGAIVRYNGINYKCITAHFSSTTLEANIDDWEVFHLSVEYKSLWATDTEYRKNDLVKYGGSIFKAAETHNSGSEFDRTKWMLDLPGYQFEGTWSNATTYQQGDIVSYSGDLYVALETNIDIDPYELLDDSTNVWQRLQESYNFIGSYNPNSNYRPGDIVQSGGNLYLAKEEIGGTEDDGSSLDFTDESRWELLKKGFKWQNSWTVNNTYRVNDVVIYFGTTYKCNTDHLSANNNFPGDNGSGFAYWDILIDAGSEVGLSTKGDLLTYGLTQTIKGDGSTQGPTRVPIGNPEQLLSIDDDDELFWRNYLNDTEVIYVAQNGKDEPGYGTSIFKPFASVRHAAEYVEDNFDPLTPVKIQIATGRYTEICPISVPAGCVVMGDELRSTTIEANRPLSEYQDNVETTGLWIDHLSSFIDFILNNLPYENTSGNTLEIDYSIPPVGSNPGVSYVQLVTDFKNYLDAFIGSGDTNPTQSSTSTQTDDEDFINASRKLLLNEEFIIQEIYYWLLENRTQESHSLVKIRNDVHSLIRAIAYDLRYTGNYKTLLSARRYTNATLGSQLDDMFYFRDVTGIRNCTLEGLEGILNPPGTFELFQRPTGRSFCSLDPGWGPADERVWINTRSPYLQGVTNIGSSCVGQKIDGALHNGGNKSMVSNDFTQVLSDGVGAWVLNNGRAELVSVFTYYCAIGYFAEDGGIIRATNGNNSYGKFGAIADGNDDTEIPQVAQVFNRNNQAQVQSVFAGEFTDQIFAFEYAHCGEEYSSAQATVVGAGTDAEVEFDDFRSGGVYQLRLVNPEGSGAVNGVGYSAYGGNAQTGTSTTITLSGTTDLLEEDIINMRLFIVSGDGTGQYGYVQAYNPASKIATIYKESDDTPGWEHILPGTPIEALLTTNSQYRIEPRVYATSPGFSTGDYNLTDSTDIIDSTFGDTSASYPNLEGAPGTGTTDETVTDANAFFTVDRNGDTYSVTLLTGGAGYAVGDTITFAGTVLGGTSPANDLVITVTSITDDSTNAVDGFTFAGIGVKGRFVVIANPNFVHYSDDGESWTLGNLSAVADWRQVKAGNGTFVAIANGESFASVSSNGIDWTNKSLGSAEAWSSIAYGMNRFVIVGENTNTVKYSTNGQTWSTATIPDDTIGDSTASQWQCVEYGQGKFVAISGSNGSVAVSSDGLTWTRNANTLPAAGLVDWKKLVYGKNIWVAMGSKGQIAYSVDTETWYDGGDLPTQDGSTAMNWNDIGYAEGLFFAVCDTLDLTIGADIAIPITNFAATSEDGLNWTVRNLGNLQIWKTITHAVINNISTWIAVGDTQIAGAVTKIFTGATLKIRAEVVGSGINTLKILDPGSGYTEGTLPSITVIDNSFTSSIGIDIRIGNGVLAQPSFTNRGVGFRSSSTRVTITGNGYADIIPADTKLTVSGIEKVPGPGAQIRILGILDEDTEQVDDLLLFRGVTVTDLGDDGTGAGTRLVEFRVSPSLDNEYNLQHGTTVNIRERYSQCRISGHDFLDIGTGNFEQTNYPELYAGGAFFVAAPENEVVELNGGRVFYTSTDQDGNFRAGELFAVEQATGIVTISADFFQLDGLSELALGGVRLGGSGTVVREFSTDPNFTEDSNSVVPTQRAVATFLANRLSEGGSELETNTLIAGQVRIGTDENVIETTTGVAINIPVKAIIQGDAVELDGHIIAQEMAFRTTSFDDSMQ